MKSFSLMFVIVAMLSGCAEENSRPEPKRTIIDLFEAGKLPVEKGYSDKSLGCCMGSTDGVEEEYLIFSYPIHNLKGLKLTREFEIMPGKFVPAFMLHSYEVRYSMPIEWDEDGIRKTIFIKGNMGCPPEYPDCFTLGNGYGTKLSFSEIKELLT